MKSLLRVLALTAVMAFACLPMASSSTGGTCRYFCGTTVRSGSSSDCCSDSFQCPDGRMVTPYAYNSGTGWRFC
jgi:hypothetical protein